MDSTGNFDAGTAAAGVAAASIWGGIAIFWAIYAGISLIFLIWWIFLIIDLTKREFPEKNTWLIIMIVGLVIGLVWLADLLYYFMVVKKQGGGKSPVPPSSPPPQQ